MNSSLDEYIMIRVMNKIPNEGEIVSEGNWKWIKLHQNSSHDNRHKSRTSKNANTPPTIADNNNAKVLAILAKA